MTWGRYIQRWVWGGNGCHFILILKIHSHHPNWVNPLASVLHCVFFVYSPFGYCLLWCRRYIFLNVIFTFFHKIVFEFKHCVLYSTDLFLCFEQEIWFLVLELLYWHDAAILSCNRTHLLPYNPSIKCWHNELIDLIILAMCMPVS